MRTVRVTHANWVSDWLAGDAGSIRVLTDEQAYEAVEVLALAVYVDGGSYTPPPPPVAEPVLTIEPDTQAWPEVEADLAERYPDEPVMTQEHVEANLELEEDFPITVTYGTPALDDKAAPEPAAELKQPWSNASKAAWVDWAVAHGCDPARAAGMTKNELMGNYGERL